MGEEKSSIWVFYFFQGEQGEERSHPNAFTIKQEPSQEISLRDIQKAFPVQDYRQFHFRFRINHPTNGTFFWLDVVKPNDILPKCAPNRIICKVLRLHRSPPMGLFLRRKKVEYVQREQQAPRTETRSATRNARSSGRQHDLPPQESQSHQKDSLAPLTIQVKPLIKEEKSTKEKQILQTEEKPKETQHESESFEDFLSGGGGESKKRDSVDLMANAWDKHVKQTNDNFMTDMDPLSPQVKTKSASRNQVEVAQSSSDELLQGGQTVGPVTLAEMERVSSKSSTFDGTQVYNPKFINKSSKSREVQKAIERREQEKQEAMERSRGEVRSREKDSKDIEAQKQQALQTHGTKLKLWSEENGRKKNIRTLLSTMHTVMWEGSKWSEAGMAKLLNPLEVKKTYRRAMLVVHPDKNSGRTSEQLVIAEWVFDAINTAWGEFERTEMNR